MNSVTTLILTCSLVVLIHAPLPNPFCKWFSKMENNNLEVYPHREKSLENLYCEVSRLKFESANDAMDKLTKEVKKSREEDMKEAFSCFKDQQLNCEPTLYNAECIAVKMYSADFYFKYNQEFRSGKLNKFKVFTALLQSAVTKLSKGTEGVTVYRGVSKNFTYPDYAFHFKQFVSTSLSERIANKFRKAGKLLKFVFGPNTLVANIKTLSRTPAEEEFLVSPFQAINHVREEPNYTVFSSYGDANLDFNCK